MYIELTIQEIIVRVLLAVIFGGVIGLERTTHRKPAGFVTNMLVCTGASIVSMLQISLAFDTINFIKESPEMIDVISIDTGRITAQVISGVGFLGAGAIFFNKDKVHGITTAATIWIVAILGLVIGYGYYTIAIVVFVVVIFIMLILRNLQNIFMNKKYGKKHHNTKIKGN